MVVRRCHLHARTVDGQRLIDRQVELVVIGRELAEPVAAERGDLIRGQTLDRIGRVVDHNQLVVGCRHLHACAVDDQRLIDRQIQFSIVGFEPAKPVVTERGDLIRGQAGDRFSRIVDPDQLAVGRRHLHARAVDGQRLIDGQIEFGVF